MLCAELTLWAEPWPLIRQGPVLTIQDAGQGSPKGPHRLFHGTPPRSGAAALTVIAQSSSQLAQR